MPKRLVNGVLMDVDDVPPEASRESNSSRFSTAYSATSSFQESLSEMTWKDIILYGIPAWGINVPIVAIFSLMLILYLLVTTDAAAIAGCIAAILLFLGYSPPKSDNSTSSSSSSDGMRSSRVRTVRDLPPLAKPGG